MSKKKVVVIGAGPCGLAVLNAFSRLGDDRKNFDLVCYEKQDDWGGLWNYTWRTGTDKYGEPVHGSMYRYLWSNGPKECLEFADYSFDEHFGKAIPSFPPRAVLEDYILGRARKMGVRSQIQFSTALRWLTYDKERQKFLLATENLPKKEVTFTEADYVVVSTGHFSVPHVPEFSGIESFPGRVMHSHDFRSAEEFVGKDLIVVGGSYSAEDIAMQSFKYGAKTVTISYRTQAMGFDWPSGIEEVPEIVQIDRDTLHFKDGSSRRGDAIICCTGYLHHFPFIEKDLRLETGNRLYPPRLYKGVVWEDNPHLHYIGMQDQFYTFSMFDLQAYYARDVIMGKQVVPSADTVSADIAAWVAREEVLADDAAMIDFQTDYCKDLAEMVDYPHKDFDMAADLFKEWEHDKEHSILGYRDKAFRSPVTGTMGTVHHTKWWEEMDDSMTTFLSDKG